MTKPLDILAISGSLRRASTNTALLRAASAVAPANVELTFHDYAEVPLFNGDLDADAIESVVDLKRAIAAADAILLAIPEYNYSLPGVLKNAIDWASRPAYESVFRDKPVGVLSAAASFVGGARGQQHAKTVLLGMGSQVFPWPELLVPSAHRVFVDGKLRDEATERRLRAYVEGFAQWVSRVG